MILKIQLCLVLIVAWINKAACASVSKIYVQSGAETLPLDYYQYGAPGSAYSSPQNSVVPISSGYVPPCVTPCVYPSQTIASFGPVPSSANLLSHQSSVPSLPIATSNYNEPARYKYAYVVYDQNTGDKKSQSEMSDGSVVQGEYSFLQPDGYIREVQYVADDLKGFSAIVTNYLPVTEEETKGETTGKTKPTTPSPHVKSEPIKHIHTVSETETSSKEKHALSVELKPETSHEHTHAHTHENHVEGAHEHPHAHTHENHVEGVHEHPHESHGETSKKGEENLHEGSHENVLAESHDNIPSEKEVLSKELHNTSTKEGHETTMSTTQKSAETLADASVLVPYKDIIKCIESLLGKASMVQTESPLAYIVLNKPC